MKRFVQGGRKKSSSVLRTTIRLAEITDGGIEFGRQSETLLTGFDERCSCLSVRLTAPSKLLTNPYRPQPTPWNPLRTPS